jgi:hypothetical protein
MFVGMCQLGFYWEISVKFDVWDFRKICLENKTLITIEQKFQALYVKNLIDFNVSVEVK